MANAVFFTMAYNAQSTIRRTIESVLNQTKSDFEYYVLDNGSTDNTNEIACEYARYDERIKRLRIENNEITSGGLVWGTLVYSSSAKYITWCDADDEYTLDFLENMVRFSEENHLDIAACGYEMIDGQTNEVIKTRALAEHLLIHDSLFADEFINYRGFTNFIWGKLFSIPFLRKNAAMVTKKDFKKPREYHVCKDSIKVLNSSFKRADRVGIYSKAMYKYYQYPRSLSRTNIESNISSYSELWHETKRYLEHFGPISKINEDFLYAIHLSLVEEAADRVFASDLPTDVKLKLLAQVFNDPVWAETMNRVADPQFRNLAARNDYVRSVKIRILTLPGISDHSAIAEGVIRFLE
jgi:glycosyltransferase involved in cell wall biosynthesis